MAREGSLSISLSLLGYNHRQHRLYKSQDYITHMPPASITIAASPQNTMGFQNSPVAATVTSTDSGSAEDGLQATTDSVKQQDENDQPQRKRKRKLVGPPYVCEFPGCGKEFHRSEHLSRHQLNHNPKKIYKCSQPSCDKTFVRHDLLVRHMKRHENKVLKQQLKQQEEREKKLTETRKRPHQRSSEPPVKNDPSSERLVMSISNSEKRAPNKDQLSSVNQIIQQHHNHAIIGSNNNNKGSGLDEFGRDSLTPNLINWLFNDDQGQHGDSMFSRDSGLNANPHDFFAELNDFQLNNTSTQTFFIPDGFEDFSPVSNSSSLYSHTPRDSPVPTMNRTPTVGDGIPSATGSNNIQFPPNFNDITTTQLCDEQLAKFDQVIPGLSMHPDFTPKKLEMFLRTYWKFFHPRFPILHRPSFIAREAPPLLLLAMFVLGCKLSTCVPEETHECHLEDPKALADIIALPLRWLLFSSPDFEPPAKIWVIQSLLMLEFYEKNCSTRQLHERSHLHHGTTIQLLRRSPTLGGSPHKLSNILENADNWYKWIEVESLKRVTYMCFYIDAIDAISFGHQMLIYAHQIQMTMPAEDELWESNLRNFNLVYKKHKRPEPFLLVLKNILNGHSSKTNSFGKKVILAGLSALMFQIQQRDLQLSFGLDKFGMSDTVNNWRELLTAAFTIWRNNVGGSCCSSKTAIENSQSLANSPQFSTSDTRCKCITYHMAHVYMSISLYDLFIFAGAPWRMNVKPSSALERQQIAKRVSEWCDTRHAKVCVVQCYLLLFEMFLSPQDSDYEFQYDYLPDSDIFFRSNVIGLCALVIWCYNSIKSDAGPDKKIEDDENGYRYLKRIRKEFSARSNDTICHTWFTGCSGSEFYGRLMKWVEVLDDIPKLDNMVGVLDLVGNKLKSAQFTVGREIGRLLLFCKERSQGSGKMILETMYDP